MTTRSVPPSGTYALARVVFHGTYLIPVVTWHYRIKGQEGRWNGLAGCLFTSLN